MINTKMDRSKVVFLTHEQAEKEDDEYWMKASAEEKFETVTYLRECFYGKEATTGRLQRIYQFLKFE